MDIENRELEQQVEIFKDPNYACECVMAQLAELLW